MLQLHDVFAARHRLFLECYRHRVVVGLDALVGDLLRLLEPLLRVWIDNDLRPSDALLAMLPHWIACFPSENGAALGPDAAQKAMALWRRIRERDLYRLRKTDDVDAADIRVRIGLSALDDDPVTRLWFYEDDGTVHHMAVGEVSKLLGDGPRLASETLAFTLRRARSVPPHHRDNNLLSK